MPNTPVKFKLGSQTTINEYLNGKTVSTKPKFSVEL